MDLYILLGFNIAMAVSFALGYYVGHRGLTGVQSDLSDIKQDIANVKGKLEGIPAVVQVTPSVATIQ